MFNIEQPTVMDKTFRVYDEELDIEFFFDYDDVDHKRVMYVANAIVTILNANILSLEHGISNFEGAVQIYEPN